VTTGSWLRVGDRSRPAARVPGWLAREVQVLFAEARRRRRRRRIIAAVAVAAVALTGAAVTGYVSQPPCCTLVTAGRKIY
jgi:hypothetical protein